MNIEIIGGGPAGLYFALLMKKADPSHRIRIYEQNSPDDTFGFGVVFSAETLGHFRDYDDVSYDRIRETFAYWDDIVTHYKGTTITSGGHGFCGMSRKDLLLLLQARCRELVVTLSTRGIAQLFVMPRAGGTPRGLTTSINTINR